MKKLCMCIMLMCFISICNAQPPVTSGLKLHLDAASGFSANGTAKATWTDLSLSGNDMESGVSTREPVYTSSVHSTGFPGILFDGVDDYMVNQTLNNTFSVISGTLFFVKVGHNYNASSSSPTYKAMISIADDSTILNEMGLISDWALHHSLGNNYSWQSHPCIDSLGDTIPVIHTAVLGTGAYDVVHMINGSPSSSSVSSLGSPASYTSVNRRITIGGRFHDNIKTNSITEAFDGYVLEVIAYNRKLTAAEITSVNNYLFNKYYNLPTPATTFVGDTVCQSSQSYLTFTETGGPTSVTISYTDGTNSFKRTVTNGVPFAISPSPTTNKIYTLTGFSHGTPCRSITFNANDTTYVNVLPIPVANAGRDTTVCGNSTQLSGSGSGNYTWASATGTVSNPNISNPIATTTATTNYYLEVKTSAGCADTDTVVVIPVVIPTANAGRDTTICSGVALRLLSSGGVTGYHWYAGGTSLSGTSVYNPVATPLVTTTYSLRVLNGICADSDDVVITVNPTPVANAGRDTTVCGNSTQLVGTGTGSYFWYSGVGTLSNPNISNPIATTTAAATYFLEVKNTTTGCADTDAVLVTPVTIPNANAGPDTTICDGYTIQLRGAGGVTGYHWYTGTGLSNTAVSNPVATPLITTTYSLRVLNGVCADSDDVVVTVLASPLANAGKDTNMCGNSTRLNGSGTGTYFWYSSAGSVSNATIINPIATTTVAATYFFEVKNAAGCTDTDAVLVTPLPIPVANAGADTSVCSGLAVQLQGGTGTANYRWYPGTGLSDTTISNPVATPAITRTYSLRLSDGNCADTDEVVVTVLPSPFADAGQDTTICGGATVRLNGSGAGTYAWYPAGSVSNPTIANPFVTATKTTEYILVVTSGSCHDTDIIVVGVNPKPVFHVTPDRVDICEGNRFDFKASGGDSYLWYPTVGLSSATLPLVTATHIPSVENIQYHVIITDSKCKVTDTLPVDAYFRKNPLVDIAKKSPDPSCVEPTTLLEASGAATYQWIPETLVDKPLDASTTARVKRASDIMVIGTDNYGCKDTAQVHLTFKVLDSLYLMVPNIFTPNGDGKNDYFGVHTQFPPASYNIRIYNRWGNHIFESSDINYSWDGRYKGKEVEFGSYNYMITIRTEICGSQVQKGTVEVVR